MLTKSAKDRNGNLLSDKLYYQCMLAGFTGSFVIGLLCKDLATGVSSCLFLGDFLGYIIMCVVGITQIGSEKKDNIR